MGGYLNKIGLHGHPLDADVRVLKEPRTVPYNRIGSLERIRTVSVPYRSVSRSKELEGFRGLSPPTGYAECGAVQYHLRSNQALEISGVCSI